MPQVLTNTLLLELAGSGGGGFNPTTLGTCIFSGKGNTHLYTDSAQAVPVALHGDLVQQWRDEREAPGGSLFPYGNQATSGSRPSWAPNLTSIGGVAFNLQSLTLTGLPAIDKSNCTIAVCGLFWSDMSYSTATVQVSLGDIPNQMAVLTDGIGADLNVQIDASYDGADHSPATPTLHLTPYACLTTQALSTGLVQNLNGVNGASQTAPVSHSGSTGYVGDWSAHNAAMVLGWLSRVLVYSPALSPGDLATLQAGLIAETTLISPWPASYNVVVCAGDSLTLGIGHGTITSAQTYPAQLISSLVSPLGHALTAQTGKTIDQVATAYFVGINGLYSSTFRTGKQCVLFWAGTNDCEAGTSGATMFTDYKTQAAVLKAAGWKVGLFTIMNNAGFSSGNITQQGIFNTSIRADFNVATSNPHVFTAATGVTYADFLVDVQSEPNLQTTSNMTYFSDGTHLTATGYGIVATDAKVGLATVGIS